MTAVKPRTYSVNIRAKAAVKCGLTIKEQPMIEPIAGILALYDQPTIFINVHMSEAQKRQTIANILAVCIKEGERINCIVAREVPDDVDAIARRLLLPENSFRREEKRLRSFGALRYSILSTLFQTTLAEVLLRANELDLTE